jgi:ATP-binding cassette subfamily F protein uup
VVRYPGNYTTWRRLREEAALREKAEARETDAAQRSQRPSRAPGKPRGGLTFAERLELDGIMEKIDAAELEVAELEGKLAQPGLYAGRGDEVRKLIGELELARARAAQLTARWEDLEGKKDS